MSFKDMKGLRYIHALIEASPDPIDATDLIGSPYLKSATSGGGEAHDEAAVNGLQRRLDELAELRSEAIEKGDQTAMDGCDKEVHEIEEYLKSGTDPGGRPRPLSRKRPGDQIGKAIRRALRAIKRENRPLAEVFARGILDPSGGSPRYVPGDDEPEWILR